MLTILYATQTGNSEALAQRAVIRAEELGWQTATISAADATFDDIVAAERVLLIVSTYDDGDFPHDAFDLWDALEAASDASLETTYAVLALGDSSYDDFCAAGRAIDESLASLGATRAMTRIELDTDFLSHADSSIAAAVDALTAGIGRAGTDQATTPMTLSATVRDVMGAALASTPSVTAAAHISSARRLSGSQSQNDVWQVTIDLMSARIEYEPGDSLSIRPVNSSPLVEGVLEHLGVESDLRLPGLSKPLGQALAEDLELRLPHLNLLSFVDARIGGRSSAFGAQGSRGGREWLVDRDVLDVLAAAPAGVIGAADLVAQLRPIQMRTYSIASSPIVSPGLAELLVSVVGYDLEGRRRTGAATTHLVVPRPPATDTVSVRLAAAPAFRLPDDPETPVLMIGPGTGVAPFRSFVQHRAAKGARGPMWLMTGGRHRSQDFLYRDELEDFHRSGVLNHLDFAGSRDQPAKVYVQDLIRGSADQIATWVLDGAHVYICGAAHMSPFVEASLVDAIAKPLGGPDRAKDWWAEMRAEGRLRRDVY